MLLFYPGPKAESGAMPDKEAVQWAARCPLDENGMIELRRIFEFSDAGFPPALVA
jgi:hypothetical protein